ncbi:MAG: hypothetical protein LAN62_09310 [Acidobacteriia bacterium]|nr:hypothetical protein [Terriglobia bacterium]
MKLNRRGTLLAVLLLILSTVLLGPTPAGAQETSEGVKVGNYNLRQSIELGYRWTDFTGNEGVFDTFVNLHQGPRLLGQTLEMRPLTRGAGLFDNLYLTSFGYGGDPNNFSMLRVSKDKWYNFNATFRRDQNYWNYDLLANPLNPAGSNPTIPIIDSPHRMALVRRMSNVALTLLPQSRVRFRLGYSRNINDGPSLSSIHEGTDTLLFQDWKTTLNAYQVGIDFRLAPRTQISYDQFFQYFKGDTSYTDQNFGYQLANGTPVDLGLIYDTANRSPCAAPITNATTTPPTASPTCNAFLGYSRVGPMRTKYPTEQVTLQSSSIKNLDVSSRFVYSSSNMDVPIFNELFQGLDSRTAERQLSTSGPATAKRISVSTDFAATYYITPKLRLVDEFRFWNFRIPAQWVSSELALFGTRLNQPGVSFNPATCPPPYTAAACPPHTSSSGADVASGFSSLFIGQDTKLNTFRLEYDFTKRIGGRLGYRYRHRTISQSDFEAANDLYYPPLATRGGCTSSELAADGSCQVVDAAADSEQIVINEHSLLMGLWFRPIDSFRITYDMELMSADNTFTRISPRQLQQYKLRANYKPTRWMNLGGTLNVYEARNNVVEIDNLQHNRSYGFTTTIAPQDRWALDLGYDYNNVFSTTNICYSLGSGPAPPGSTPCPILASGVASLAAISTYSVKTDFSHADFMFKPVKQVTLNLGYSSNSVNGVTLILNPNAFPGPLQSSYTQPYASAELNIVKGWTIKGAWGFYNYREQPYFGDLTTQRGFRGNLFTLSFRYSL